MTAYMERAARLACWKGAVAPEPLGGGITNVNGEHGLGDALGDRFRLRRLHRGESRTLRVGLGSGGVTSVRDRACDENAGRAGGRAHPTRHLPPISAEGHDDPGQACPIFHCICNSLKKLVILVIFELR